MSFSIQVPTPLWSCSWQVLFCVWRLVRLRQSENLFFSSPPKLLQATCRLGLTTGLDAQTAGPTDLTPI
jgi:hypothetical protein